MDRLESTADKDRLEVRVSWTEYHSDSYNEMLPQAPGLRDPLKTLELVGVGGTSGRVVHSFSWTRR